MHCALGASFQGRHADQGETRQFHRLPGCLPGHQPQGREAVLEERYWTAEECDRGHRPGGGDSQGRGDSVPVGGLGLQVLDDQARHGGDKLDNGLQNFLCNLHVDQCQHPG